MAASDSRADAVLEALGFALFLRQPDEILRLQGAPPDWLRELWPGLTKGGDPLPLAKASPFLENFLIDARECWGTGGAARVQSGAWVEQVADGSDVSLEATALTSEGQGVLLLERLGEVFEVKKSMLQKARETVIAYQRLNSETQKKEILLSCIAEEMNAALANAITALRLIEMEKHSPRAQQLLALAMRATEDQQGLINKVLTVFAAELEGLYGRDGQGVARSSLGEVLRTVRGILAESFAEKHVELRLPESASQVAIDADHLVRIVASLLENALESAAAGSEISLQAEEEVDAVVIRASDQGAPMPHDVFGDVFAKNAVATSETSPWQLRLQFCRMAVEKCRGEIGYEAGASNGNRFWIRLPKVT
ncbi:MAG TPA: HAMP domain-containing sensor histidine kinase [Chthoniobacterales bacterium]|jgi:signal transduction histidine kinase